MPNVKIKCKTHGYQRVPEHFDPCPKCREEEIRQAQGEIKLAESLKIEREKDKKNLSLDFED